MIDEESDFLNAIRKDARDDVVRLVYADWLDEREDPRGELLRLQVKLSREWSYANRLEQEAARLAELARRLDRNWVADVWRCTTPPPPLDIEAAIPELKGRGRTMVRLHPKRGEAPIDASKIGGLILWPRDEPWPFCDEDELHFIAAMQLRKEDVPELGFPDGTDLFQMLWCPEEGDAAAGDHLRLFWRKRSEIADVETAQFLVPGDVDTWLWPEECRLHPERVTDYPSMDEFGYDFDANPALNAVLVENWQPSRASRHLAGFELYSVWFGAAAGHKVGGHPAWIGHPTPPVCQYCGARMQFWFQFDSDEPSAFRRNLRWVPIEESVHTDRDGPGWSFSDRRGRCLFFHCPTCDPNSAVVLVQSR